ncbi:hypothetical protein [Methanobacterium paludis]|uniref:Uncharacterized protein n=1 Tax=Methanobacterium paludis (strain DSM 25820 / JCM 18151 / SWAN1) TaxID=868131 RepID=F6D2R9_METPW|nr:hypothetical protein [Methanobacterium paludis]AEG18648.1 hypothetical protein MSWAN_1637 [Methanobacterium paludis]
MTKQMIAVDEDLFDSLLLNAIPEIKELEKAAVKLRKMEHDYPLVLKKIAPLTFKPNLNLGEGKASERNLEYRQSLLTCLEDSVNTPTSKLLAKKLPTTSFEEKYSEIKKEIGLFDGYIEDYISNGQGIVKDYQTNTYKIGADEATSYLLAAAKKQGAKYKPIIPDNPVRLQFIIDWQQKMIEDYGLVLRGRIRNAFYSKGWSDGYGNSAKG